MNTVYKLFLDYFHNMTAEVAEVESVEKGIAAYLESIGIKVEEETPNADVIAHRELLRFKLMPEKTFVTFFENYGVREEISQFIRDTELAAMNRATKNETIGEEIYRERIHQFYSISKELAKNQRYTTWLEAALREATNNLKYAVGASNKIPDKVAERIMFAGQYE